MTGFSRVTPTLRVDTTGGSTKWILDGFRTEADKAAAAKANSFMNAGYKSFMTEVNNLNKRMGELRDTNGDAGLMGPYYERQPVQPMADTVITTPTFRSVLTKTCAGRC